MRARERTIMWCVVCAVSGALALARPSLGFAQTANPPGKPWSEGVSPEAQTRALDIYNQGNALFGENQFVAALQKYREALAHWDHPRIRHNIAICLIELDQPVEALDNLEQALKHGDAPFDAPTYAQAQRDLKSLHRQVAELEVSCDESGAEVTLDGRLLFVGPGKQKLRLVPGPHALVATKREFVTASRSLVLMPGKATVETITLMPLQPVVVMKRRWARWKPWTVAGVGAGVALIGIPLRLRATDDIDNYNAYVNSECGGSCPVDELPAGIRELPDRARTENAIGISLIAVGSTAAVAGVVLIILNLPRQETLAPMAVSGGGGISATVAF